MKVREEHIKYALRDDIWDLGNRELYKLCKKYPDHRDPKVITAKVWLIGRSYATAIERTRNIEEDIDSLYENRVIPILKSSNIDKNIGHLRNFNEINDKNLKDILETHKYLVDIFEKITSLNNRSLASKYLHFHLPKLYFLFDSRALKGIRVLKKRHHTTRKITGNFDEEYSKFYLKALDLQDEIEKQGYTLTPRQIDRVLLRVAKDATKSR